MICWTGKSLIGHENDVRGGRLWSFWSYSLYSVYWRQQSLWGQALSMEFCQHCLSDGCNWVGLGETITNYKVSSCPFACHRLRPTLPANFFIIFFVEVFVFNIWVPDLFGCHRIFFFGCHFMPVSSLTNSYVMLFLEQWASSNRAHLCLHSQEDQEFAKSAVIFIPISIEKALQLLDFLIESITSSGR